MCIAIATFGDSMRIPVVFNFFEVILKCSCKAEPEAFHMEAISEQQSAITNDTFKKIHPPSTTVSS